MSKASKREILCDVCEDEVMKKIGVSEDGFPIFKCCKCGLKEVIRD